MMKTLITLLIGVCILSPNIVLGETFNVNEVISRNGILYKKSNNLPLSGTVTGKIQGSSKNGKKYGLWVWYHDNGQLFRKVTYNENELDDLYAAYWMNGQLMEKGTYKIGKKVGAWVTYWMNGQLKSKGAYRNGKKHGSWFNYNMDGTVKKIFTGTYKNGVKVSD